MEARDLMGEVVIIITTTTTTIIIITIITTTTTITTIIITATTKMSPGRYEVEASCTFSSEAALDVAHELPEHQETIKS